MAAKDYANTRYSALRQITADNVKDLKPVITFSTGVLRGHEAAPIVVDGTMYIVTPYPNYLYALDLTKPGAPTKWKFEPNPKASSQGVACCDVVNRGAAFADGRVFINTLDGQTVAVDAASGKELWRKSLGDISKGETITMAPIVVKGKVLVGNSGGEYGVRGWLDAHDAEIVRELWRAYSTGPDRDVARTKAAISASRAGRPAPGKSAAAMSGAGSPTIRLPISSITAPPILGRGIRSNARAPTSGPRASSLAIPIPAKHAGSTSSVRTICTTTTASTRTCWWSCHWPARRARCCCIPTATATST